MKTSQLTNNLAPDVPQIQGFLRDPKCLTLGTLLQRLEKKSTLYFINQNVS